MPKTYRALVCCRAGIGSSMMLEAKCKQVIAEEGLPIKTRHGGVDELAEFDGDLVITMTDLVGELEADPRVPSSVGITNIVDKDEIRQKLVAWLEARA
ncbi:MAG TPA: PTS sugar transporter subunit IIB [Candidatus Olsenella pullicola]|nr:PTS sugar transporter subunit IIB [Candidatus Olsenella pullicola]